MFAGNAKPVILQSVCPAIIMKLLSKVGFFCIMTHAKVLVLLAIITRLPQIHACLVIHNLAMSASIMPLNVLNALTHLFLTCSPLSTLATRNVQLAITSLLQLPPSTAWPVI